MNLALHLLIWIPLAGFLLSLVMPDRNEKLISTQAFLTVGLQLIILIFFVGYWATHEAPDLDVKDIVLYKSTGYEFFIDFMFDKITATYLLVGALLTFLVTRYSQYYLHREKGYKRFFNTILFFYLGFNVVVLSGNLETMFIGWEILGISSFLLIAFYRERYLPVKNAVKVFSIYRIADVGLILAMWLSHHLWHENVTFLKMSNAELVHEHLQQHSGVGVMIALMILLAAAAKSAQLPFSSWLPRAMEGPTPSSAIFYGSLSVHIGVFILLRTYHFWEHQTSVRIAIGLVGGSTALVASLIARVQSSVKSQIAYSSVAQIGIIFIEVAFGWVNVALIHFAGNAFLRTYQLLVSPSVVTYLIREQFYHFKPRKESLEDSLPRKLENALYVLSLKEWNLDYLLYKFLWNPLKRLGNVLSFLNYKTGAFIFIPVFAGGLLLLSMQDTFSDIARESVSVAFAALGLILVLKAFTERKKVLTSWLFITYNHLWIILAVSFNEHFTTDHVLLYLSGVLLSSVLGYICLSRISKSETGTDLDRFHGHVYKHRMLAFVFLVACLGLAGFPITPTFIGEDLIFSHVHEEQLVLAFLISLSLIVDGLALIRIYARVFLGPHVHSVYEMGYRSS